MGRDINKKHIRTFTKICNNHKNVQYQLKYIIFIKMYRTHKNVQYQLKYIIFTKMQNTD